MRALVFTLLTSIVLLISPFGGLAQENLKSGPQVGDFIPGPFHALNATGKYAGDPHCLVCEYGLQPVVAVFCREIPEGGKPLGSLLQKLDDAVSRHYRTRLKSFVVYLTEDVANEAARKELLASMQKAGANLKNVVLAVDSAAGPESYNIHKEAAVTVVLYDQHRVVANFAFAKDKLMDKDVSAVLAAVEKLAAGK